MAKVENSHSSRSKKYMLRSILVTCLILVTTIVGFAQNKYLNGHWKGYITKNLNSEKVGLIFELYLEVKGNIVNGVSYVHEEDGTITEMEIKGYIYGDRSIWLGDRKYFPNFPEDLPPHVKTYQFVHNRSIFDSENTLEGFWQEVYETPLSLKRRRGKCVLRRVEKKGKA